jgi:hypothetical protein
MKCSADEFIRPPKMDETEWEDSSGHDGFYDLRFDNPCAESALDTSHPLDEAITDRPFSEFGFSDLQALTRGALNDLRGLQELAGDAASATRGYGGVHLDPSSDYSLGRHNWDSSFDEPGFDANLEIDGPDSQIVWQSATTAEEPGRTEAAVVGRTGRKCTKPNKIKKGFGPDGKKGNGSDREDDYQPKAGHFFWVLAPPGSREPNRTQLCMICKMAEEAHKGQVESRRRFTKRRKPNAYAWLDQHEGMLTDQEVLRWYEEVKSRSPQRQ